MRSATPLNLAGPARDHIGVEQRRLREGLLPGEPARGLLVDCFSAMAKLAPTLVVDRVREIMTCINTHSDPGRWPSEAQWFTLLPGWFVEACAPEISPKEATREIERWHALSEDERRAEERHERRWRLTSWVFLMAPEERWWLWWDAGVANERVTIVGIDRLDDGFPDLPGEFVWMLKACGAIEVESFAFEHYDIPFPI